MRACVIKTLRMEFHEAALKFAEPGKKEKEIYTYIYIYIYSYSLCRCVVVLMDRELLLVNGIPEYEDYSYSINSDFFFYF